MQMARLENYLWKTHSILIDEAATLSDILLLYARKPTSVRAATEATNVEFTVESRPQYRELPARQVARALADLLTVKYAMSHLAKCDILPTKEMFKNDITILAWHLNVVLTRDVICRLCHAYCILPISWFLGGYKALRVQGPK